MVRTQTQTRTGRFKNLNSKIQKTKTGKGMYQSQASEPWGTNQDHREHRRTGEQAQERRKRVDKNGTATGLTLGREQTNQQKNEGTTQA